MCDLAQRHEHLFYKSIREDFNPANKFKTFKRNNNKNMGCATSSEEKRAQEVSYMTTDSYHPHRKKGAY